MLDVTRHDVRLLASLRAATTLEAKYGFAALLAACADGNLTVIADIVETSSDCRDFLKSIEGATLASFMPALLEMLYPHVLALAGIDPEKPDESQGSGETIPFKDYHARLFRIATGWLQWSPKDAWEATPNEITEAYSGHLEMLRAIYGSADDDKDNSRPTDRPENACSIAPDCSSLGTWEGSANA
jgi:hypothetical protein